MAFILVTFLLPVLKPCHLKLAARLLVITREDELSESRQHRCRLGVDLVQDEVQELPAAGWP